MTKVIAVLAIPLGLLALVASLGVVFVDVREGGPNGHHVVVPVPLLVAQTAAAFVPERALRLDAEAARHIPVAREVLRALADAPDCELVRVEERGERVVVSKVGDTLRIRVREDDSEVTVNLPLDAVLNVLPPDGRTISASAAVGALRSARFTDIVDVRDGRDHVRVWVW